MNLRFKTSWLPASPKKLKAVTAEIKGKTLDNIILLSQFSHKSFSKILYKDFNGIKSNLMNVRGVSKEETKTLVISKAVIEKRFFFQGYRTKARGHISVSRKQMCVLNIYLRQKESK